MFLQNWKYGIKVEKEWVVTTMTKYPWTTTVRVLHHFPNIWHSQLGIFETTILPSVNDTCKHAMNTIMRIMNFISTMHFVCVPDCLRFGA